MSRRRKHRGSVLIYTFYLITIMFGFISFGVDFGHVQTVKTEMQRGADATARAALQMYITYGSSTAAGYAPFIASQAYNPDDGNSGVSPTVLIEWGSWNTATKVFTAGGSSNVAVRVTISRTATNNNAVNLAFPLINGRNAVRQTCDVWARAVAYIAGGDSGTVTIPSTASLYLAGMPAGSTTAGWGDNTSNAAPYKVTCVNVTPGTYVTIGNTSGTSSVVPGYVTPTGAGGNSGITVHHGENYDHNPDPGYTNAENGIADATMYEDAMCGVFLTNNAPSSSTAPAGNVDWTTSTIANQATFTNIQLQQPFMIGNGKTTGGATKQFLVPPGATQLYLSIWDGVCYSNNAGTISGTISVPQTIKMAQ